LSGFIKLGGSQDMVSMFTTIGVGQWLRYLIGAIEIAGAIGLLIPQLSGLAALGLVGLMIGATATNLFIISSSPWFPLGLLLACALITWGRWPQTRALFSLLKR
jgi:putative oxidoreductase